MIAEAMVLSGSHQTSSCSCHSGAVRRIQIRKALEPTAATDSRRVAHGRQWLKHPSLASSPSRQPRNMASARLSKA